MLFNAGDSLSENYIPLDHSIHSQAMEDEFCIPWAIHYLLWKYKG